MSSGSLEVTLVSASIARYIPFENEPCDTYAILRCTEDQHSTKNARDQGRLPVWNETFVFDIQEHDMSNELLIQVFNVRNEVDKLLGLARIPIYTMVGKEEATLCALLSPTQTEIGKLKAAWKWKPGSQKSMKATSYEGKEYGRQGDVEGGSYTAGAAAAYGSKVPNYASDYGMAAYPPVFNPNKTSSDPYSNLDAVSDAVAKLAVGSGRSSGRSSSSYSGDSFKSGKEAEVQDGFPYHQPSAPYGNSPTGPLGHGGFTDMRASDERKGNFGAYSSPALHARGSSDQSHSLSSPTNAYPLQNEGYHPYSETTYPPPSDAYPPNKETYPSHLVAAYPPAPTGLFPQDKDRYPPHPSVQYPPPSSDTFPQSKDEYPPYPSSAYPPPPSDAYMSSSGAYPPYPGSSYPPPPDAYMSSSYPPNKDVFPSYQNPAYPPYPDYQSTSSFGVHGEEVQYMEKGGGSKERGGSKKEKEKGHGSHAPYGQPPPSGYQYPPAPSGYPTAVQGYPPAPHGYPPAQHGYPPAPHGYPPAPHGYPSAPQGYPPHSYPSASPPLAAPYGYPSSAYESHSGKHGHGSGHAAAAAGAYVAHSSSASKPSKKHKEPKHSSHKHDKHKKEKSFKGLKFKKFKF